MNDPISNQKAALLERVKADVRRLAERVVESTPVNTGAARSSWMAAINGDPGDTYAPATGRPVDKNGSAALQQIDEAVDALQLGDTMEIVNTTYYLPMLENGSRTKAPGLFIRTAALGWGKD